MTRLAPIAATAAACAAFAAACSSTPPEHRQPSDRYGVVVRETRERVEIPMTPDKTTLDRAERQTLEAFAKAYGDLGHGPVLIALPNGLGVNQAGVLVAAEMRAILNAEGVPYEMIQGRAYDARSRAGSPIVAAFTRYVAEGPTCNESFGDFALTGSNANTSNFGCWYHSNLAAMISDPRDLLGPRASAPADTARRNTLLESYRSGETTATERSDDESAAVSDVE